MKKRMFWNINARICKKAIHQLFPLYSKRRRNASYNPVPMTFGEAAQDLPPDTTKLLNEKGKKQAQQVIEIFKYLRRAVDLTILMS